jgi:FAD/FMN-containing dehydrogenase
VIGSGLQVATLDYLDAGSIAAAATGFPGELPPGAGFMVIAEADGSASEARRLRDEVADVLAEDQITLHAPETRKQIDALWRWRDGVGIQIAAQRHGKVSEDIVVPVDRLADAIEESIAIGTRHGIAAVSWGHAGDGNLHSSFLVDPGDHAELERGEAAAEDLFALAVSYGGAVSGEHGIGWVKRGQLARQWSPAALELHDAIKRAFDPKGLLNPGKKPGIGTAGA